MIVITGGLAFAGCILLALSQSGKWTAVMGSAVVVRTQHATRAAGGVFLGAAFAVSLVTEGAGFAALLWTLQVALASFIVALMLSFRPGWLRPVARACFFLWP